MAIPINEVKAGMTVEIGKDLFRCIEYHHQRSAQQSWIRIKFKNVRNGAIIDKTFKPGERVEPAHIEYKQMQFLYSDDDAYHFMDQTTYEQVALPKLKVGDASKYIKEGAIIGISFYQDEAIDVSLPPSVELKVVDTSPGFKGDTVSGTKPATMETGVVINVPFFVNVGDLLKVGTQEGTYLGRA